MKKQNQAKINEILTIIIKKDSQIYGVKNIHLMMDCLKVKNFLEIPSN